MYIMQVSDDKETCQNANERRQTKMLKKLEGYQIKTIFKYMAKKDGFGLAECSTIEKEKQQEEILSVLKKKGKAFGIYRKKELAACYLFEKVKVLESEIPYPKYDINKENVWNFITGHEVEETKEDVADESENLNDTTEDAADANDSLNDSKADEKKATADKEVYVYRLAKIYNQSVPAEVAEEFEKAILAEFKELIAMDEVKAVLWTEKILAAKRERLVM